MLEYTKHKAVSIGLLFAKIQQAGMAKTRYYSHMSRLSFKAFCIEKYADYRSIPSNEVFKLFEENDVLTMLDRDYDILHGFGFEYIANDIDQFMDSRGRQ